MKKNCKTTHPNSTPSEPKNTVTHVEDNAAELNNHTKPVSGRSYFEVAKSLNDEENLALTQSQKQLFEVQGAAIDLLLKAYNSMIELAAVRLQCKLSNTRVTGVARELKELIKVMSVYDC